MQDSMITNLNIFCENLTVNTADENFITQYNNCVENNFKITRLLKRGTFSSCFQCQSNHYVVKTSFLKTPYHSNHKSDGQPYWIKKSLDYPNEYTPKYYFTFFKNNRYFTIMEKLLPIKTKFPIDNISHKILANMNYHTEELIPHKIIPNDLTGAAKLFHEHYYPIKQTLYVNNTEDVFCDINEDNLALRKYSNNIVILDPYWK